MHLKCYVKSHRVVNRDVQVFWKSHFSIFLADAHHSIMGNNSIFTIGNIFSNAIVRLKMIMNSTRGKMFRIYCRVVFTVYGCMVKKMYASASGTD